MSPVNKTQPPHFAHNEKPINKSPAGLNCALNHTWQDQLLIVVELRLLVELRDCKLSNLFHIGVIDVLIGHRSSRGVVRTDSFGPHRGLRSSGLIRTSRRVELMMY